MVSEEWLSADELAAETGTSVDLLEKMSAAGILRPGDDGSHRPGDVQRVLVATAMIEAGLSIDLLGKGIEAGIVSFEDTDAIYPPRGRLGSTVAELGSELGTTTDTLLGIVTALGIARRSRDPASGTGLRAAEGVRLGVAAPWRRPAAHACGARVRRRAPTRRGGLDEPLPGFGHGALADRALPWDEMRARVAEPGLRVQAAARSMLPRLLDQHLYQLLNQ